MRPKMESPGALARATGAELEAANFTNEEYSAFGDTATAFAPIGAAALRVVRLVARHGLTPERAALVAPLAFGEGRA